MANIKIGIDLDNTIIDYQNSFKKYLKERKIYLKVINKNKIKQICDNNPKIESWTKAQEEIYGKYISSAKPFKYFKKFEKFALSNNIKLYIVSHKTKYSQFSKKYNLHYSSNNWLKKNINKNKYKIFYVDSVVNKIKKIQKIKPNYFIDDLIKIFKCKQFPKKVKKIYFSKKNYGKIKTIDNWKKITEYIIKNETFK